MARRFNKYFSFEIGIRRNLCLGVRLLLYCGNVGFNLVGRDGVGVAGRVGEFPQDFEAERPALLARNGQI